MGNVCCNKKILLDVLRRNTNENNPLTRHEIEKLLKKEGVSLDRKTFGKYVVDLECRAGDKSTPSISCVGGGPNTKYYYVPSEAELTEEEIRIAIDSIFALKSIAVEKKLQIKNKLLSQVNVKTEEQFNNVSYIRRECDEKYKPYINQSVFEIIMSALEKKRELLFDYTWYVPQKEKIIRHHDVAVYPQAMIIEDGFYYLIAYKPMANERRYYRIDRISKAYVGAPIGNIPSKDRFVYEEFVKSNFKMFRGEVKEITFKSSSIFANQIIDKFGDYTLLEIGKESFIFKTKIEIGNTFYGWLSGFAGEIKIIAPLEEVEAYKEFLKKLV